MSDSDIPTPSSPDGVPVLANQLIEVMHQSGQTGFGYDRPSVELTSRWLDFMVDEGDAQVLSNMEPLAAAFVGECLRLEHGGEWVRRDGRLVLELANGVIGDTFAMAYRQVRRLTEENLASLYRLMAVFGSLSVDELYQFARGQLDLSDRLDEEDITAHDVTVPVDRQQ